MALAFPFEMLKFKSTGADPLQHSPRNANGIAQWSEELEGGIQQPLRLRQRQPLALAPVLPAEPRSEAGEDRCQEDIQLGRLLRGLGEGLSSSVLRIPDSGMITSSSKGKLIAYVA